MVFSGVDRVFLYLVFLGYLFFEKAVKSVLWQRLFVAVV